MEEAKQWLYRPAEGERRVPELPDGTEEWSSLAWRPAGSSSLAEKWLRAGEPARPGRRRARQKP